MRTRWLLLLALPLPAPAALTQAAAWSWTTADPVAVVDALAVADLDGDGLPDLLVGTVADGAVEVEGFRGVGDTFEPEPSWHVDGPADGGRVALVVADLDADGFADILLGAAEADGGSGAISLHPGGPLGPEPLAAIRWTGGRLQRLGHALAVGDVDGDGVLDLLAGAPGQPALAEHLGLLPACVRGGVDGWRGPLAAGPPAWRLDDVGCVQAGGRALAVVDADADGDDDVVRTLAHHGGGWLAWHAGGPAGPEPVAFAEEGPLGEEVSALAPVGDTDGDGLLEVASGDRALAEPDGRLRRWSSTPPGVALHLTLTGVGEHLGAAIAGGGDLDGDGWPDLVAGGPVLDHDVVGQGRVTVVTGAQRPEPTLSWVWGPPEAGGGFGRALAIAGDLDGDARADVVVAAAHHVTLHRGLDPSTDQDGDGVAVGADCDDADATRGAPAWVDACRGRICRTDTDGDGHGTQDLPSLDLDCLDLWEADPARPLDCEDDSASVHPGAPERVGNDRDDDCDGVELCRADADGDGWPGPLPVPSDDTACDGPGEHAPVSVRWADGETELTALPLVTVAGDVDGDGWTEVVLRFPDAERPRAPASGVVALYSVRPGGLVPTGWRRQGAAQERLGRAAVGGLDVNADGAADLVLLRDTQPPGFTDPAWTLDAWYGGPGGPGVDPDWSWTSDEVSTFPLLSGGDVDGDGFDDVLLEGPGGLLVLAGGPAGLPDMPTWVIPDVLVLFGVGDPDADGDDDLMVRSHAGVELIEGGPGGPATAGAVDVALSTLSEAMAWGDLDGDGLPDHVQVPDQVPDGVQVRRQVPGDAPAELVGELLPLDGDLVLGHVAVVPDDDGDGRASLRVHRIPTRHPFRARGRVESWVIDGGGLVPDVVQLQDVPVVLAYTGGCRPMMLGYRPPVPGGTLHTLWSTDLSWLRPDPDDGDAAVPVDAGCGPAVCRPDADGDGAGALGVLVPVGAAACGDPERVDCDDTRPDIHDRAPEVPGDGVDQDCDGLELCPIDADGDGWGDPARASPARTCAVVGIDCDDRAPAVHPGDPSCDGDGACLADGDGDHVAAAGAAPVVSADGDCLDAGEARPGPVDCDDADPARSPLAVEVPGDGVDQDCDGVDACPADDDGDGFTGPRTGPGPSLACPSPPAGDCDDDQADVHPGGVEHVGDGVDGDCDGRELCLVDADEDGAAGTAPGLLGAADCGAPGVVPPGAPPDCDDLDAARSPLHVEIVADGIDGDCDGEELCTQDLDDDGFPAAEALRSDDTVCGNDPGELPGGPGVADCDDQEPRSFPGGPEAPSDGIDGDCDGAEACLRDDDGDGWPSIERTWSPGGRCDEPGRWRAVPHVIPTPGVSVSSLAVADVDGDGDDDLVTVLHTSRVQWHPGPLGEDARAVVEVEAGAWVRSVGDLDGDGQGDVVVVDPGGAVVLRGTPDGPQPSWTLPDVTAIALQPIDADRDGRSELITADSRGRVVMWRVESGDLVEIVLVTNRHHVRSLDAGDVDGDGRIDLAIGLGVAYAPMVVLDVLDTAETVSLDGETMNATDVVLADIDGDGRDDAVVARDEGRLEAWRWEAVALDLEQWWRDETDPRRPVGRRLRLADLDGNGTPEIVSDGDGRWSMALWWTAHHQAPRIDLALGTPPFPVDSAAADFGFADADADGRPELVVAHGGELRIVPLPAFVTDCDDLDPAVHPTAVESLGLPDTDCVPGERCPLDADGDGHAHASGAWGWSDTDDCRGTGLGQRSDPVDDCDDHDPAVPGRGGEGCVDADVPPATEVEGCGCGAPARRGPWPLAALVMTRRRRTS